MANLTCANAIMLLPYRYHYNTLSSGRICGTGAVVMNTNIARRIRLFVAEVEFVCPGHRPILHGSLKGFEIDKSINLHRHGIGLFRWSLERRSLERWSPERWSLERWSLGWWSLEWWV